MASPPRLPNLDPKDMQWIRWVTQRVQNLETGHALMKSNISAANTQRQGTQTAVANTVETADNVLTINVPEAAPQVPALPVLVTDHSTVTITWTGKVYAHLAYTPLATEDDAPLVAPAIGFNSVNVYRATAANGPYVLINYITTGGTSVVDADVRVGNTYWYRFVTIDNLRNSSDPGPSASIVVKGVDLGTLDADVRAANKAVADTAANAQTIASQSAATAGTALNNAATAQQTANDAQTAAGTAQSAASSANSNALAAANLANGKGKIWFQTNAPVGNTNDLWIDTSNNANTPKRYDGTSWVTITDKAAIDAAQAAAAANTAAQQAQNTANAAQQAASNAQTSANGKNKITYSVADASNSVPGTQVGDVWYRYNGQQLVGWWRWDGSAWQAQVVSNSVIGTLDAGKITTGTLDAARIAARSITAQQLAVSALNTDTVVNGSFENGLDGWVVGENNGSVTLTNDSFSGGQAAVLNRSSGSGSGGNNNIQLWQATGNYIPVVGGDSWYASFWAKSNVNTTNGLYLRFFYYDAAYNQVAYDDPAGLGDRAVTTSWAQYGGSSTVPANAKYLRLSFYNTWSGTSMSIDYVLAQKRFGGELIVDGTITGNKIQAGAITTEKLSANSVTTNKIAAGAIDTDRLAAGVVTTSKLNATAIDGMTITGAVFRTSGNATQYGVVIDSNGLRAYQNYAETIHIDSYGNISLTGYINATGGNFTGSINAQSGFISGNLTVNGRLIAGNSATGLLSLDSDSLRVENNQGRAMYFGATSNLNGQSAYTTALRWGASGNGDPNAWYGLINASNSSLGYGLDIRGASQMLINAGAADLQLGNDGSGGRVFSSSTRQRVYASNNRTSDDGNRIVVITPSGTLGVLTGVVSSNYQSSSSRRFKHDIEDWRPDVRKVLELNPVRFKYNDGDGDFHVGMIAEQMDELGFNELVTRNPDGDIQTIEYLFFGAALLHVAREQQKQIDTLTQRLTEAGI